MDLSITCTLQVLEIGFQLHKLNNQYNLYGHIFVVTCTGPRKLGNQTLLVNATHAQTYRNESFHYGHTLSFACSNGSYFLDGDTKRRVRCIGGGKWMPDIIHCKG